MFVVDTNVLVYAADKDSPFHEHCRNLLETWRREATAWYLTWGIVYEFLRVTTHPGVMRNPWSLPAAWGFIEAILAAPSLGLLLPTKRHREVLLSLVRDLPHLSGNRIHDAHIAALMREHGIKGIYTRDTDFHRFPFLEPIDPIG